MTIQELMRRQRRANGRKASCDAHAARCREMLPALALLLALAGCAASRYPDLREIGERPTPPETIEEREASGVALLQERDMQRYQRDLLRYRVGLIDTPPERPLVSPVFVEPEQAEPVFFPPSQGVAARYLRQQIEAETDNESLNDFLDLIVVEPLAIDQLTLAELLAEEEAESEFYGFGEEGDEGDDPTRYQSNREVRPLLDRALVGIGIQPHDDRPPSTGPRDMLEPGARSPLGSERDAPDGPVTR
jgi:hypothetical protein